MKYLDLLAQRKLDKVPNMTAKEKAIRMLQIKMEREEAMKKAQNNDKPTTDNPKK